jgi:hypothetical protein
VTAEIADGHLHMGGRGPGMEACCKCGAEEGRGEGGVHLTLSSGCKAVRYCCTGCQKAHWPLHKRLCRPLLARQP